jgi:flagellar protein FliO/FliZ
MDPAIPGTTGFGAALLQSALALAAVCALAWWALRWGARRGVLPAGNGRVAVIERAALDPGRAVYVVRVGERVLVVGASEQSLSLLAELRPEELPAPTVQAPARGFAELVARLRGGDPGA